MAKNKIDGRFLIPVDSKIGAPVLKIGDNYFLMVSADPKIDDALTPLTVTAFTPAKPACAGLSQIVVSGLTDVGSEEDGDLVAYSSANGTYLVTPETERIAAPFGRIYRHTSGKWYIWGEYEAEYEEGYWYIGPAQDSGSLVFWSTEALSNGTVTFEDWDWGYSFDVTLHVTETSYPDTPVVLNGVTDSGNLVSLTGYSAVPQVGRKYGYRGDSLIGRAIDVGNGIDADELILLTHWGTPYPDRRFADESGYKCELIRRDSTDLLTETSQATSLFGNPILSFNHFDSSNGHIVLKKVPKAFKFTIEYWECFVSNDEANWGGVVLVNKTCYDASGDWDESTLISAHKAVSNKIVKQWFHRAFVHDESSEHAIVEYINGVKVANHAWNGDVFYSEERDEVYDKASQSNNYEISIFGDDEYIFCPGGRAGYSSGKYVAQLAIWGRGLSDTEIKDIVRYKQPYHL